MRWGAVAVDLITDHVFVTGDTYSTNFPTTPCAMQSNLIGSENAFITHFYPDGTVFCSSYFGKYHEESANLTLYGCYIYLSGYSGGVVSLTTAGAYQTTHGGGWADAYLAQLYKNTCGITAPAVTLTPSQTNSTSCSPCNGSAKVSINTTCVGNESYSYVWSNGSSSMNVTGTTNTVTGLCVGNYTVTVTSNCDQTQTRAFAITGAACNGIAATATGTIACMGVCTTIFSAAIGGTAPYSYSWSTSATTQNISPCPVATTTYTITITDNAGKIATSTAVVTVNPAITASVTPTNINCNGGTGSAIATAGGGTPAYTYSWSNSVSGSIASGLGAGNYTVTITDSKGCTATSTSAILSPSALSGEFTKGTANCTTCGCKQWIMITATGGTGPYTYLWPDGSVRRYKNQLCPDAYTVNIKDKNGCSINIDLAVP